MRTSPWVIQTPWGNLTWFRSRKMAFEVFRAMAFRVPGWVIIGRAGDEKGWGASEDFDGNRELMKVPMFPMND